MDNRLPIIKKLLFFLIIIAVVFGGIYYASYMKARIFQKQYRDAKDIHLTGDANSSVDAFRELADTAPDKAREGKAKILLAANLFTRNQGDDQSQAIKTYLSVVNDYKIPPVVRSSALNDIAFIVRKLDESLYKLYFPQPPFDSFLPTEGSGSSKVFTAYYRILRLSDETYPNANAEYAIAGDYYAQLRVTNQLGDTTPEEAAKIMQDYVKEGDKNFNESQYLPNINLRALFYRAIALNSSNKVLNNLKKEEIEQAFKSVLDKGALADSNDYLSKQVVMNARFFYANFLRESFGAERHDDIRAILKPFAEVASSNADYDDTRLYFQNISKQRAGSVLLMRVVELAKISPEFKVFAESVVIQ